MTEASRDLPDRADGQMRQSPGGMLEGVRIDHVALSARDFEQIVAWYCDVLGFTVDLKWSDSIPGYDFAYLRLGEMRLEVVGGANPSPPPPLAEPREQWNRAGFAHLCFGVDDVAATLAELESRGVEHPENFGEVVDVPEIGVRIAFLQDPEGNVIELMASMNDPEQTGGAR